MKIYIYEDILNSFEQALRDISFDTVTKNTMKGKMKDSNYIGGSC